MPNFFHKLERFLVNLMIFCLILVIISQLILHNEQAQNHLYRIQSAFNRLISNKENSIAISSQQIRKRRGIIVIELLKNQPIPQVWVLKNGQKYSSFDQTRLIVTVAEGDLITIDSRYYSKPLRFEISALSADIISHKPGKQFHTNGDTVSLGIIEFKGEQKL